MQRPETTEFWINDRLPVPTALGLSLEQLAFLGALLVVPNLFAQSGAMSLGPHAFLDIASATLLVCALSVLLQVYGRWGVGAGYYYPQQATPTVFAIMLVASSQGGLALAYGMIFITGLTQILLSGVLVRLRNIFTVEVAGVAVMLTGITTGKMGLEALFGIEANAVDMHDLAVATITLAVLVFCNIWVRARFQAFTTLAGLAVGTAIAAWLGMIPRQIVTEIADTPWLRMPDVTGIGWQFDPDLIGLYALMGLSLTLMSLGTQTVAQRAVDADWHVPDLRAYARGLRAEGLSHMIGSFLNAMPQSASGGAVGLATSAGCTSRYLGYWVAGALIFMALCSKLIVLWLAVPAPVIAALMFYLAALLIMTGLRLIASRMLDNRRAMAVGLGCMVGVANQYIVWGLESSMPALADFMRVAGGLNGVLVALILTLVFRIGATARTSQTFIVAATTPDDLNNFISQQGRLWGARRDSVQRVRQAVWEAFDLMAHSDHIRGTPPSVEVQTRFDDYALHVRFIYEGQPLPLAGRAPPSPDEMLDDPQAAARLSSYLLSRLARRVQVSTRDGLCHLDLYFDA
ncbi:purine/pyrimidine permease [Alcaligenaceae bacterium]|nr:purine/pyrimidine permease [Alcaligenaceae bacterium]